MQIHRDKRRRYCEIIVCVLINTYISKYTSWECVIHVVKIRFKPFHEKVLLKAFLQLRHWEYFKKCQPTWLVEEKCQRNWLVEEKCQPTWLVAKNAFSLVCDDMSNMSSIHCVNLSASGAFLVCIIIIVIIIIIIIIIIYLFIYLLSIYLPLTKMFYIALDKANWSQPKMEKWYNFGPG